MKMETSGWIQLAIYVGILLALTKPMGIYLVKVLDANGRTFLDPVMKPFERLLYRIFGVDPQKEQNWKQYSVAMLLFSAVGAVFTYAVLRLQQWLPWHGTVDALSNKTPLTPHLAFNTAMSFTTNT
ncbi:MAG TPA: potassium-transporting ATPase subunit KdpA, partial [Tepidisphaeraceae bacterium]